MRVTYSKMNKLKVKLQVASINDYIWNVLLFKKSDATAHPKCSVHSLLHLHPPELTGKWTVNWTMT